MSALTAPFVVPPTAALGEPLRLDSDDFVLMGLPRRFAIDLGELDQRWRALQAKVHPDRFVAEGPVAQRLAMQWSVRVNEAHRRLRDPLRRGAYLCELAGVEVGAERNTAMPAAFLQQQMAWREALDEACSEAQLRELAVQVGQSETEMQGELARCLDERGDVPAAAALVRSLMFVQRFSLDVEQRLQALN